MVSLSHSFACKLPSESQESISKVWGCDCKYNYEMATKMKTYMSNVTSIMMPLIHISCLYPSEYFHFQSLWFTIMHEHEDSPKMAPSNPHMSLDLTPQHHTPLSRMPSSILSERLLKANRSRMLHMTPPPLLQCEIEPGNDAMLRRPPIMLQIWFTSELISRIVATVIKI